MFPPRDVDFFASFALSFPSKLPKLLRRLEELFPKVEGECDGYQASVGMNVDQVLEPPKQLTNGACLVLWGHLSEMIWGVVEASNEKTRQLFPGVICRDPKQWDHKHAAIKRTTFENYRQTRKKTRKTFHQTTHSQQFEHNHQNTMRHCTDTLPLKMTKTIIKNLLTSKPLQENHFKKHNQPTASPSKNVNNKWLWVKKRYLKNTVGKRKNGLKPVVPKRFSFWPMAKSLQNPAEEVTHNPQRRSAAARERQWRWISLP